MSFWGKAWGNAWGTSWGGVSVASDSSGIGGESRQPAKWHLPPSVPTTRRAMGGFAVGECRASAYVIQRPAVVEIELPPLRASLSGSGRGSGHAQSLTTGARASITGSGSGDGRHRLAVHRRSPISGLSNGEQRCRLTIKPRPPFSAHGEGKMRAIAAVVEISPEAFRRRINDANNQVLLLHALRLRRWRS